MPTKPTVDPWLLDADGNPDPFAANIQYGMSKADEIEILDDQLTDDDLVLQPEVIRTPRPDPETPPEPVVVPPEPDEPLSRQLEDGSTLTITKEKGWWVGTVTAVEGGQPQIYKAKTKDDLIFETLKAQGNSTKKIRELNRRVKLGVVPKTLVQQQPAIVPNNRSLSADEIFEIKTQLNDNPDLALESWFQKKTNMSLQQLVTLANKGAAAEANLETDGVCRAFIARNHEYYGDQNNQNFKAIVDWIAKYKLGRAINPEPVAGMYELHANGVWQLDNLEEAYEDLKDDLIQAPRQPKQTPPVVVETEPVPAPRPNERIVQTVTRPRAALGIRPADVTPVAPPATPTAPTDEDLEKLSDEDIAQLYRGVRRARAASSRR